MATAAASIWPYPHRTVEQLDAAALPKVKPKTRPPRPAPPMVLNLTPEQQACSICSRGIPCFYEHARKARW
jgi:hypothetical protein